jgi:hypothetical protein
MHNRIVRLELLRTNIIVDKYQAIRQLKLNPAVFRLLDSCVQEHVLAPRATLRPSQTCYAFSVFKEDRQGLHYGWWVRSLSIFPGYWTGRYKRTELF